MLNKTRSVLRSTLSQILVEWGAALNKRGETYTYETDSELHYSRHRPIAPLMSNSPAFAPNVRISYTASIEGAVQLGNDVVVGHMSTLRADLSPIRVGPNSIIGDNVAMHTLELHNLVPGSIDIGSNVYIGDKATLRCCIIDDSAYIGEGSFIAEGAIVQRGAIVLPNTVVQPGAILTSGKVWGGSPSREIAEISDKYASRAAEKIRSVREIISAVNADLTYISTPNVSEDNADNDKPQDKGREKKEDERQSNN